MLFSCLETIVQNKGITTTAEKGRRQPLINGCLLFFSNSAAEKIPGQAYRYQRVRSGIDSQDVNNF